MRIIFALAALLWAGAGLAAAQAPEVSGPEPGWLQQIIGFADAGGPVILVLMAVSVFGLGIVLLKAIQFTLVNVGDHRFVGQVVTLLRRGDLAGAEGQLANRKSPVALVMRAALQGRRLQAEKALVREEVERVAQAQLDALERGLPLLSLVASISPLIGLLGTVTGLVEAFQQLQSAGDRVDPAILSGGIWEALLTTVMGLSIAIPASALYLWFQRTVELTGARMEDAATQVVTVELYRLADAAGGEAPAPSLEPQAV